MSFNDYHNLAKRGLVRVVNNRDVVPRTVSDEIAMIAYFNAPCLVLIVKSPKSIIMAKMYLRGDEEDTTNADYVMFWMDAFLKQQPDAFPVADTETRLIRYRCGPNLNTYSNMVLRKLRRLGWFFEGINDFWTADGILVDEAGDLLYGYGSTLYRLAVRSR